MTRAPGRSMPSRKHSLGRTFARVFQPLPTTSNVLQNIQLVITLLTVAVGGTAGEWLTQKQTPIPSGGGAVIGSAVVFALLALWAGYRAQREIDRLSASTLSMIPAVVTDTNYDSNGMWAHTVVLRVHNEGNVPAQKCRGQIDCVAVLYPDAVSPPIPIAEAPQFRPGRLQWTYPSNEPDGTVDIVAEVDLDVVVFEGTDAYGLLVYRDPVLRQKYHLASINEWYFTVTVWPDGKPATKRTFRMWMEPVSPAMRMKLGDSWINKPQVELCSE